MRKNLMALAMLCGMLLVGSTALFAQGSESPILTFKVPVTLNDMLPEAKGVAVRITLQDEVGRTITDKFSKIIEIPDDGNLPKTIFTVEFSDPTGSIAEKVTQYKCELYIYKNANGTGGYPAQPAGRTSEALQYCTAKDGTPFVGSVTGPIEW